MQQKEFHLCSEAVIQHFPDFETSKPFRSGYKGCKSIYYVALIDWPTVDAYYKRVIQPFNERSRCPVDFWCRPCEPSFIDTSGITLTKIRKRGLFVAIEDALNLTKEQNIAFAIWQIANDYAMTPVELINRITPQNKLK